MTVAPESLVSRLEGYRLHEVDVVLHQVRLRFTTSGGLDGPQLTCTVLPTVTVDGKVVASSDERWAGLLRGLITQHVESTHELTGVGIRLELTHGSVRLHPPLQHPEGAEVARLEGLGDGTVRVWRSGSECFADVHSSVDRVGASHDTWGQG